MKITKTLGAVVAAGLLACAGEAAAAQWVATYKGHVNGGFDTTGVFGAAGTDLGGLEFVATFTYDTGLSGSSVTPDATGEVGLQTLLGATLSIGGSAAFDFGSGFDNRVESRSSSILGPFGPGYVQHSLTAVFDIFPIFSIDNQLTLAGGAAVPAFLGQAVAETPVVNPGAGGPADFIGYFQIEESSLIFPGNSASGSLRPDTYSVAAVASAPEPGAWALMILGFGGVGAALRRRVLTA